MLKGKVVRFSSSDVLKSHGWEGCGKAAYSATIAEGQHICLHTEPGT